MSEDKIYPTMVIRSQAEAIELLEKENQQLKKLCNKYEEEHKKEFNTWTKGQKVLKDLEEWLKEASNYEEYDRVEQDTMNMILDKIQELKEKYK